MKKAILVSLSIMLVAGCASTQLSALQRRSIEAKELNGKFDDAFKATLAVLQDEGFIIKHTDYDAGVIMAKTGEESDFWWSSRNLEVTATIEQFGEKRVKERITFVEKKEMEDWGVKRTKIIEDPEFMQKIYDDIQKEMFVRQNLNK